MTRPVQHIGLLPSPYPKYDQPLQVVGDTLILPDVEAPFHDADFINKVLVLSHEWKIENLVLAGDAVHWASLSAWGADWKPAAKNDETLLAFMQGLGDEDKKKGIQLLEQAGILKEDDSVSGELANVRIVLRALNSQFKNIYWVLGNHEDRLLRKLQASLSPTDLLTLMGVSSKWQSAPYYYCMVISNGNSFRVTHPRGTSNKTPCQIAIKHQQHVIMGHSHKWMHEHDPSGKFHAIHAGHCVDESRLPYAAQRDSAGYDAHCKGAVIIKDGYPYLLEEQSQFSQLARLK